MMKPAPAIRLLCLLLPFLPATTARAADVARIGGVTYPSLPLAVAAARSNDVIVLVADAVLDDTLSVTLPLAIRSDGHPRTITRSASATNDLITVSAPGALCLGTPDGSDAAPTLFFDGGAATFPAVTNAGSFVYAEDASVTIHPGVVFRNWRGIFSPLYVGATTSPATAVLSVLGGTFRDNCSATYGGAIYSVSVPATIHDAAFLRNSAAAQAGAVGIQGTSLDLARTTFASNSAVAAAGGLFAWNTTALVTDSLFVDNRCSGGFNGRGGGAYFESTSLDLSGTTFLGNGATDCGGALCLVDCADALLSASSFASNSAPIGEGGALAAYSSVLAADGLAFSANSAWAAGGAALLADSDSSFLSTTVVSNSASVNGAGFYASGGSIGISSSTFSANAATDGSGGALYLTGTTNADLLWSVSGSAFSANSATYGGAIYAAYATGGAAASGFASNSASAGGGAIWVFGDADFADTSFSLNSAAAEGGAVFHLGGTLRLDGTTLFTSNSAATGPSLWSYNGAYEPSRPATVSFAGAVSFDAPIALYTNENTILLSGVLSAASPVCTIDPPVYSNGLPILSNDPSASLSFSPISRYYAKFAVLPAPDGNPWFIDAGGCLASARPPAPPVPPEDLRVFEAISPSALRVPPDLLAYDFSLQSATTLSNGFWDFAPCGRDCLVGPDGVISLSPEITAAPFCVFRLAFE